MVGLCVLNLVRTTIYGKIKNESRFSFSYQPRSPIDEATRQVFGKLVTPYNFSTIERSEKYVTIRHDETGLVVAYTSEERLNVKH